MSMSRGGPLGPAPVSPSAPSRPWSAAVWVLGAAAAAAVLFVSGLVTGFLLGSNGDGASTAAPDAPVTAPGQGAPGRSSGAAASDGSSDPAALDACVVGSWRSVEHEESFSTDQGPVSITGLVRQMDVEEDGRQTITYEGASATMTSSGSEGTVVYDGTVVYQVGTSGGSMSFELVSSEGTLTVTPAEGEPRVEELRPGTGAVRYTCDDARLTQEAEGFRAVYERTG